MPGWWNGRHRGLKILWAATPVRVRVSPSASQLFLNDGGLLWPLSVGIPEQMLSSR